MLVPAARAAGVPWASFHSLRHTAATLLFAQGRNVKQVSAWLGHTDASFTLRTYIGLLDSDVGGPLDLDAVLGREVSDETFRGAVGVKLVASAAPLHDAVERV